MDLESFNTFLQQFSEVTPKKQQLLTKSFFNNLGTKNNENLFKNGLLVILTTKSSRKNHQLINFFLNTLIHLHYERTDFFNELTQLLLKCIESHDYIVRCNSISLLGLLRNEIDVESCFYKICERLFDLNKDVRKQSLMFLKDCQKMMVKPKTHCVHLFRSVLKSDTSPDVRATCLTNVLVCKTTLKAVVERSLDKSKKVRRVFFENTLPKVLELYFSRDRGIKRLHVAKDENAGHGSLSHPENGLNRPNEPMPQVKNHGPCTNSVNARSRSDDVKLAVSERPSDDEKYVKPLANPVIPTSAAKTTEKELFESDFDPEDSEAQQCLEILIEAVFINKAFDFRSLMVEKILSNYGFGWFCKADLKNHQPILQYIYSHYSTVFSNAIIQIKNNQLVCINHDQPERKLDADITPNADVGESDELSQKLQNLSFSKTIRLSEMKIDDYDNTAVILDNVMALNAYRVYLDYLEDKFGRDNLPLPDFFSYLNIIQNSLLKGCEQSEILVLIQILTFYDIFSIERQKSLKKILYRILINCEMKHDVVKASFNVIKCLEYDKKFLGGVVKKNYLNDSSNLLIICSQILAKIQPFTDLHSTIINEILPIQEDVSVDFMECLFYNYVHSQDSESLELFVSACEDAIAPCLDAIKRSKLKGDGKESLGVDAGDLGFDSKKRSKKNHKSKVTGIEDADTRSSLDTKLYERTLEFLIDAHITKNDESLLAIIQVYIDFLKINSKESVIIPLCKLILSNTFVDKQNITLIMTVPFNKTIREPLKQYTLKFLMELSTANVELIIHSYVDSYIETDIKPKFLKYFSWLFTIHNIPAYEERLFSEMIIKFLQTEDQDVIETLWPVFVSIQIKESWDRIWVKKILFLLQTMVERFDEKDAIQEILQKIEPLDDKTPLNEFDLQEIQSRIS